MKKLYTFILLVILASAASFSGCSESAEPAPTLFSNVDRIVFTFSGSGTSGIINYTLPNGNCDKVVIGVFDTDPAGKVVNNAFVSGFEVKWGTRTGLTGFVLGSQPLSVLYPYSSTISPSGDFNTSQSPLSSSAGKWIAIWAYDSGGTLVASSAYTTF